jgi:hypothetical protein
MYGLIGKSEVHVAWPLLKVAICLYLQNGKVSKNTINNFYLKDIPETGLRDWQNLLEVVGWISECVQAKIGGLGRPR